MKDKKPCACKGEIIGYRNVYTIDGVAIFFGIGTLENCNLYAGPNRTHVQEIRAGEMYEVGWLENGRMSDVAEPGRCPDECDPQ